MKKYFCLSVLLFSTIFVSAQQAVFADGSPVKELKYSDIIGSELYNSEWRNAEVLLNTGARYNLSVKYNIYADELFFQRNNQTMSFVVPVKEFVFNGNSEKVEIFRNGYPINEDFNGKSFYQVLIDGRAQLLKKLSKQVMETKDFNSSVVKKRFTDLNKIYAFRDNQFYQLKRDRSSILNIFSDKSNEIAKYISDNKINLKKDDELIKVFNYYNSL